MNPLILSLSMFLGIENIDIHLYPPPSPPTVVPIINELGSPNYVEREAAMVKLKKIGYPALTALDNARKNDVDPEIRMRANA
jgi:hypothetical protein